MDVGERGVFGRDVTCVCVCMYVCKCVYIYMYVCIFVCMYECMCVCDGTDLPSLP